MNLLLVEPDEIAGGRVTVKGRRARHLIDVVNVREGDALRAGAIGHRPTDATVDQVLADAVIVRMEAGAANTPGHTRLLLALPRPKVLSRTVRAAASFGLASLDLVNAWRVERSYFQSPRVCPDALASDAVLGCEQGATTAVPTIVVHKRLMPCLDALPEPANERRVLLHPHADVHLEDTLHGCASAPVWLAIGPEGGWIEREIESFIERGFVAAKLGAAVLRTEAAVVAALAQLELVRRLR